MTSNDFVAAGSEAAFLCFAHPWLLSIFSRPFPYLTFRPHPIFSLIENPLPPPPQRFFLSKMSVRY